MTTELTQAIQIAQSLSPAERLQLLKILAELLQETNEFETQNQAFWQPQSIDALLQVQKPPVINNLNSLTVDFWQDDESEDDFLVSLQQQRQPGSVHLCQGRLEN